MRKQVIVATTAIVLSIATTATGTIVAGIGEAMAAETGTKTMPDSNGAGVQERRDAVHVHLLLS